MKIAILHEMLIKRWGAEKVVESLIKIFPNADLYTLIYDKKKVWKVFPRSQIHPQCHKLLSQKIYNIFWKQRLCLPFMKKSVESLDFSGYQRVIVSSSWFAHGLITHKNTKTIIYYHAPARYMWDWTHEYRREIWLHKGIFWFFYGKILLNLRLWDYETAQKNDILLANSRTTQKRIYKYYRQTSQILYPPIETKRFAKKIPKKPEKKAYYIIISALSEFKKIDVAIRAFNNLSENLVIIWDGDYKNTLKSLAKENTHFLGAQFGDKLVSLVANSLGLIFPGEEDFWIVPIEVMAAGKPVFALKKWGLTETVIAGKTGEFFEKANGEDFIENFQKFHKNNLSWKYREDICKKQAEKYSEEVFEKKIKKIVEK